MDTKIIYDYYLRKYQEWSFIVIKYIHNLISEVTTIMLY